MKTKQVSMLKTKKDFINFFDSIPASKWFYGALDGPDQRHCAVGHLVNCFGPGSKQYYEVKKNFYKAYHTSIDTLMSVNDNCHKTYNSNTLKLKHFDIKGRVLAYLKRK